MGKNISLRKSPSWEVLNLIATHLDPKTLALCSCVSQAWASALSSNHHWRSFCTLHFPAISSAFEATRVDQPVSYRRLYSVAHKAHTCRVRDPKKPKLSLEDLSFTVRLRGANLDTTVIKNDWKELSSCSDGLFRFDIDISSDAESSKGRVGDDREETAMVEVVWNVVFKGWEAAFTMVDGKVKLSRLGSVVEGWISEELPTPECCAFAHGRMGSGIVADVKLGVGIGNGGGWRRVTTMSVGILSVVSWRFLVVEDGLRYLQHFLHRDS